MAVVTYDVAQFPMGLLKVTGIPGQAVWGTAGADALDALELVGNAEMIVLDEDVRHYEASIAGTGSRNDDLINHIATTKGSTPKFEYKPRIGVLKDELGTMLMSHFQSVTEAVATPFKKDFVFGSPDFTAAAGLFLTAIFKSPVASQSLKISDVIGVEKLGFNIAPGGFLQASQNFMGRGAVNAASNPSGTWARRTIAADDRFHYNDMNIKVDAGGGATAVVPVGEQSWETTREVIEVGTDPTNHVNSTWHLGKNSGTAKLSFNYDTMAYASSNSLAADYRVGTAITVKIWWGTEAPAADGDLEFIFMLKIKACKFTGGESGIVKCEIEGTIVGDSTAGTPVEMMTVNLCDAIDYGY